MIVVADASPLIALGRIGHLGILAHLYHRVVVPETVFLEVVGRDELRPGAAVVAGATFIDRRPDPAGALFMALRETLDAGEAAALALAVETGAERLIIDERRGRRAAGRLGLPVVGTLGVLVRARRSGALERLAPALDALNAQGFRFSEKLREAALAAVGEGSS